MVSSHNTAHMPLSIKIKKQIAILVKRKWIIGGLFFAGIILAFLISFLLPKSYLASSQILFNSNSVYSTYLTKNGSLDNEMSLLNSESFRDLIIDDLGNRNISSPNQLMGNIKYTSENGNTLLNILTTFSDPNVAAEIANTVSKRFVEKSNLNNKAFYISYIKSFEDRLKLLKEENKDRSSEESPLEIGQFNIEQNRIITQISELESELEIIELDNQHYISIRQFLAKKLSEENSEIGQTFISLNETNFIGLKTNLERLESIDYLTNEINSANRLIVDYPWGAIYNLADMPDIRNKFYDSLVKLIEEEIPNNVNNKDYLKTLIRNYYDYDVKINSIDLMKNIIFNKLTNLENQFNFIPFELIDNARQSRALKFYNKLMIKLNSKIQKIKNEESNYLAEVNTLRSAVVPNSFVSPNIILNVILGGLFGLIIGILYGIFSKKNNIELIHSVEDIEELGYTIISQIPTFTNKSQNLYDENKKDAKDRLYPKIIDSFRSVETFLKYGSLDKPLKTVLITSGQEGEGKSVIASNVAIALANSGNKVLLVDADLKQPQLNKFFKIKSTPSLAHYLFRKKELNEIIRNTYKSNLSIITCIEFPQNPSVIVTSERMNNFMVKVKEDYDYVIYDSTSLCSLKETAALAKSIDELILVIRAGKTKHSEFLQAEAILNEFGVTDFNIILNDLNT